MDFCPKCGGMLLPGADGLKCSSCGYIKNSDDAKDAYSVSEKVNSKDTVILTDSEVSTLPTTNETCPECGHDKAEWWMQQTRSADEAPTRFFKCVKCKHTWRAYD